MIASRQRLRTYRNNNDMDGCLVSPAAVARFRSDLLALTGAAPARLGVAVSGGPDSLALLLLAAAAIPGQVQAATVDHGLRPESAAEAQQVAAICAHLRVPHTILRLNWPDPPGGNIQARARNARYTELAHWASGRGLTQVATGHHADDQAETILLRLARGAGLAGLAGARRSRLMTINLQTGLETFLVRPLLGWRRADLAEIVTAARIAPVDDPSNRDPQFDRTHARALLNEASWLEPHRVAASAGYLAEAEEALDWSARNLYGERETIHENGDLTLDAADLLPELQRRLLLIALGWFNGCHPPPPGPKLMRALALLRDGRRCTLAGVQMTGGDTWCLTWAPPRNQALSGS